MFLYNSYWDSADKSIKFVSDVFKLNCDVFENFRS